MVLRCIREILRPDSSANDAATVTNTEPAYLNQRQITVWPKTDQ